MLLPAEEGVVEEVAGPDDAGTGWTVTVRMTETAGSPTVSSTTLVSLPESALEATGLMLDGHGRRVPLVRREGAEPEECSDRIELRLFTAVTNGIAAAQVAEEIERELGSVVVDAALTTVAERHWSHPFPYEFAITIEPRDDPLELLGWLALAGDGGWLASRDDGWRFDLWWSSAGVPGAVFLVAEVHGAEVSLLPWRSPVRRREEERPLLAVRLRSGLDIPAADWLDAEPSDEEP
jgi:hypothetical protein